jgi:cupin 2 domain-containing protein
MEVIPLNIFTDPGIEDTKELFEVIATLDDARIERIITQKPYSSPGQWYNQEQDEWVVLLRGNATIEIRDQGLIELRSGDYIMLPAHCQHRITRTSADPACIWLAVHGKLR